MTDITDRMLLCAEQSDMGRNFADTPQACRAAAARIKTAENIIRGLVEGDNEQQVGWIMRARFWLKQSTNG